MTARNSITDIPGIRVGHAGDAKLCSGTTVVVFDAPAVASVDVRGGGPGTRETALLDPAQTVEGIDAIVLAGGSAFGLDAASGTQAWLREQGRGFKVREAKVPIVPEAASSPKAEPPESTMASMPSTVCAGSSRAVSRVPGPPPRTSTLAATGWSKIMTVVPEPSFCPPAWPTRTPGTSVMRLRPAMNYSRGEAYHVRSRNAQNGRRRLAIAILDGASRAPCIPMSPSWPR